MSWTSNARIASRRSGATPNPIANSLRRALEFDKGSCWHCQRALANRLDRCQCHAREMQVGEVRVVLAQFRCERPPVRIAEWFEARCYSGERRK